MSVEEKGGSSYMEETVYGTHEDSNVVMSEKVQSLAGTIYQEFELMISRYDQDVIKTLMPLIVNVLANLDTSYKKNQEHDVELELLREDNEQLVAQFEREKTARKMAEQQLYKMEDYYEGERKDLTNRLESLDSVVRTLELKHKNSLDHSSRLEERENELKKEYSKLHERYTDLFKTHMEYMERTKLLLSTASDRSEGRNRLNLNPIARSSGPISFGFASLEGSGEVLDLTESIPSSPASVSSSPPSPTIGTELAAIQTMERAHQTDQPIQQSQATSPVTPVNLGKSQTKSEKRSGNTLYQELSFHDTDIGAADDDGAEITGSWVHPGEYASSVNDNYFGMGKEVENLILENNELLTTKNALNVVKDDLIARVDELLCEQEILKEDAIALKASREKFRQRVIELEDKLRQQNAQKDVVKYTAGGENEDEGDVPMAQRKRFTRVEMARVLMERNQYKERFMELQDAVRWTEMVRAQRVDSTMDKKNKQSIWSFFSKLFSTGERPTRPLSTPHLHAVVSPQSAMRHSRTQADFLETQLSADHPHRRQERTDQIRQVRAHLRKEDGRTQAYGWSLPGKAGQILKGPGPSTSSGAVPVPVPVFCRPIAESEPRMNLLCAAGVNLSGGLTPDGGCMIGESVFYTEDIEATDATTTSLAEEINKATTAHSEEVEEISRQIESTHITDSSEKNLSSYVWICCSTQDHGVVMIIDANNPADVIESFTVEDKHILCVASVPGAVAADYRDQDEANTNTGDDQSTPLAQSVPKAESTEPQNTTSDQGATNEGQHPADSSDASEFIIGSTKFVEAKMKPPQEKAKQKTDDESQDKQGEPIPEPNPTTNEDTESADIGVEAIQQEQGEVKNEKPVIGEARNMSTVMATMWLGTKNGNLYVHSAMGSYGKCLASLQLNNAILAIVSCASRCILALADGTIAIFSRQLDGQWDFSHYWILTLGDPKCSVRCLTTVGCTVWCGYRNKVHVVEPKSKTIIHTLVVHQGEESQLRQMAWLGDGVWVTLNMDSILRLFHAHTYQHLRDVDIEPYVCKMLGSGKIGFSFVRITALLISSGRLWIGTSNGVVISIPLLEDPYKDCLSSLPAVYLRNNVPGHASLVRATSMENIPYCSMAHAQLSFHGHRDAVTFFIAVPGASGGSPTRSPGDKVTPPMLVLSGGEGYIDFRIADMGMEYSDIASDDTPGPGAAVSEKFARSHLIVWQVSSA